MHQSHNDSHDHQAEQFLSLVQHAHEGQVRAGNTPYWVHCLAVHDEIKKALSYEAHLDGHTVSNMLLAAKGHDLYEDTDVKPQQIIEQYGSDVHDLIREVTNADGDDHVHGYVEQVSNASEQAKIIKLGDLLDNYRSVKEQTEELGKKWITDWFLPIVEPMLAALQSSSFQQFPKAAAYLLGQVQKERDALLQKTKEQYTEGMSTVESLYAGETGSDHQKEVWDFDAFVQHYNTFAKKKGGWVYENDESPHALELAYRGSRCETLAQYAEVRFGVEQRT